MFLLNKRQIYYSAPECGSAIQVPKVDASRLREGENDLLFKTEKGNYDLYRLETLIELKEPIFPTYYFNLAQATAKRIEEGRADVNITMVFANDEVRKKGFIRVNGVRFEINAYDMIFNRKVNEFVRFGNNAVEIIPEQDKLDILELQVLLAE